MRKSGYYISAITVSIIALNASTSHAFIPTIDASAIAEGIKSNIELVKQSKIVVDATKLAGEVSSTLGEVKASISELALDELAKAKEFVEEQKKNFEEAKQDYEDYKKELDDAKAELEEGKKMLEDAKKSAEGAISDAKDAYKDAKDKYDDAKKQVDGFVEDATEAYNDAKDKYNDAKSKVDGFVEDVTDAYNDAKGYYDTAKGYYDTAKGYYDTAKGYYNEGKDKLNDALDTAGGIYNTVNDKLGGGSSSSGGTISAPTPAYSPVTTPTDLETAQEQIKELKEEIERLKAAQNVSSEEDIPSTEIEETTVPQNIEEALKEIQRLKEELAKYTGEEGIENPSSEIEENIPLVNEIPVVGETTPVINSSPVTGVELPVLGSMPKGETTPIINNVPLVSETPSTLNGANLQQNEEGKETSTPQLSPNTLLPKTKGFRQRPTIENTTLYDINASAEDLIEEKYAYSAEISEKLNFAQVDAVTGNAPTGNNDATGEFIISKKLAQYCEININDTTVDALEDCVKKVITYRSSSDMKTAEKADALIDEIFYENAVGTSAAAMVAHNQASHYKEEVLIPMKQDSSAGQADIRDDIAVMTAAQEQIQNLLIDLTKAYAAQIYQQSIKDSLQMRLKDIDPDAALAEENSSGE